MLTNKQTNKQTPMKT